jgi:hypothetical protein
MRYFFNAGGRLQLKFNATGSAGTTKETNWTGLINSALTAINLDYTTSSRTGTGETLTTDGGTNGFWDLTTTDTKLIRLTQDTSPYTGSFIDVWAKVAGTAGSNGGLGTDIVFTVTYTDDGSSTFNDNINIALDTRVDIYKPETSNLTDVWGTISVASTTN